MSELASLFPSAILRTTIWVVAMAGLVRLLLFWFKPRAVALHRLAWASVLVQGLVVMHWSIAIPWYERPTIGRDSGSPPFDLAAFAAEKAISKPDNNDSRSASGESAGRELAVQGETSFRWQTLAATIWLAGIPVCFTLGLLSYLLLVARLRRSRPAPPDWQQEWTAVQSSQRVAKTIPLYVDDYLGPMLCRLPGEYRVVVPAPLWRQLNRRQRRAILQHELAHYQRGDIWKSLLARTVALLHWFNPVAWWVVRKFDETSEWGCDERLAQIDPTQVTSYARALLAIVEPRQSQLCTSAATGSRLSVRIRRLLTSPTSKDSNMKRCLLLALLTGLATVGIFRIQLVAKEPQKEKSEASQSERLDKQMKAFADKLDVSDSALLKQLQQALATPAGKVVLRDRAAHFAEEIRRQTQSQIVPAFVQQVFVDKDNQLIVRKERKKFRDDLIRASQRFNRDVERLKKSLTQLGDSMRDDTEINRLAARFFKHEASATLIYAEQLRQRLQPGEAVIARRLAKVFVKNAEGKYVLRPSGRAKAAAALKRIREMNQRIDYLRKELKEWSKEMAQTDDLHKKIKASMADDSFATVVAAEIFGEGARAAEQINRFFEQLEELTVNTSEGLTVKKERRKEVARLVQQHEQMKSTLAHMSVAVKSFAAKIASGDEVQDGWRELLQTDLAILSISKEARVGTVPLEKAALMLLAEVIEKGDDGKYLISEGKDEQVSEFIRNTFRKFREVRRHGRIVDQIAVKLADKELKSSLATLGGKYLIINSIRESARGRQFDGLERFIKEHFEDGDKGLTLKDGGKEFIQEMLADVEKVRKELKKDDF